VKAENRHLAGLLQPHTIPESKWEVISMDFIVIFPLMARRHDSIFVVVNTLTKSAHFILVRTTYQALDIARVFINNIMRLHGMCKRIISNRGSMFTNDFGLVSKRPWEPNLTLVPHITWRKMDRMNEQTKSWRICCVLTQCPYLGRVC
jgi:hypothetical protein